MNLFTSRSCVGTFVVVLLLLSHFTFAQEEGGDTKVNSTQPDLDHYPHHYSYYAPGFGSLFALMILILDIIAFVEIIQSSRSFGKKALWIALILFFPVFALCFYCCCARHDTYRDDFYQPHYGTYTPVMVV